MPFRELRGRSSGGGELAGSKRQLGWLVGRVRGCVLFRGLCATDGWRLAIALSVNQFFSLYYRDVGAWNVPLG